MDNEIKDILVKLLEGQTKLEMEVRKNSLKLETIEKKIDIIAEVQTAHKEENAKEFEGNNKLINEKTDLIETALTNTSKDIRKVEENIRNIDENIDVLKDMTGRHEVDINVLKRRPV